MEFKFVMGVDISKDWFNFCLMSPDYKIIWEGKIDNTPEAVSVFITELVQREEIPLLNDIVLILEHTGIYVNHLVRSWSCKGGRLSIVPATKVSELLGGQSFWEEKTDEIDTRRLAEYGIRFNDKLDVWQAKGHTLEKLQALQRQRSRFLDAITLLEVPVKESSEFDSADISQTLIENQKEALQALKKGLKQLDKSLNDLLKKDPEMNKLFKLIVSVEGVGPVTAREIIIATSAFTTFKPNKAKSFARYAAVTPMKKQSGKIKKRGRTSKRGNKKIRTLLTMGAISLIGKKSELGYYYERKVAEGKAPFSVINAMRNKMILRIFAVVRNQVMYQKNLNIC